MPIYAYKCASCGHADDVLQKLADAPLTVCPKCGKDTYSKQITAPQFQLKGSGWYVTDFRGGNSAPAAKAEDKADKNSEASGTETAKAEGAKAESGTPAPAAKQADTKPASPAAPE